MNETGMELARVRQVFDHQQAVARRQPVPEISVRLHWLRCVDRLVRDHTCAIAQAISEDFGTRLTPETVMAEVMTLRACLRLTRRHLRRWMRPQRRSVGVLFQPGRAWVQAQPVGCVGVVSPWNYPLLLSLAPVVDALAAGNRVLLKPSEYTPRFSALLADLVARLFEPDVFSVVLGDAHCAQAFCALPFDHLFFTGSTLHGRDVARTAAANLTPVTLELGGKSPVLLCADADLPRAARWVAAGKWLNAGQTCVAPDYVLVPHALRDAFVRLYMAQMERMRAGGLGTSVVNARHYARLMEMITQAQQAGARLVSMGEDHPQQRFIAPRVVLDAPDDCPVMHEEIFGPILPVVGYQYLDEALRFIQARPRPLALYPFVKSRDIFEYIMNHSLSGGVTWNGTVVHGGMATLPFGGIGGSGMGASHGHEGFARLSHMRAVYKPGRFSFFTSFAPPYGRAMNWLLNRLVKD